MYLLLKDLPENDSFWGQELGEYNKQICFRNFGSIPSASHTQEYKNWFLSQKAYSIICLIYKSYGFTLICNSPPTSVTCNRSEVCVFVIL